MVRCLGDHEAGTGTGWRFLVATLKSEARWVDRGSMAHTEQERLLRVGTGTYETADGRYMISRTEGGTWNLLALDGEGDRVWLQTYRTKRDAAEGLVWNRRQES